MNFVMALLAIEALWLRNREWSIECKGLGLIPHGDLFGTWVFGKKTSFAVLIKLLLNFQVGVRGYMFFLLGKKLF